MAREVPTIELADITDLAALVDEVHRSHRPRILRHNGEDVAVLLPTTALRRRRSRVAALRPPTAAEVARSRAGIEAAVGTWSGSDTEALKKEFRRQREVTTRPPVKL
jgi:hypothetical protein